MKVRIIQLLCPARHCMMAVTYVSPDGEAMPDKTTGFRVTVQAAQRRKMLKTACGVCRSEILTYEDTSTDFATLAEAAPLLQAMRRQEALRATVN